MGFFRGNGAVFSKADASPVTEADIAAHDLIVAALGRLTPDIPIVSEESDRHVIPDSIRFWLVDPLDGTRGFVRGHTDFCVNIALIEGLYPVLGVIGHPATGEVFAGDIATQTAFRLNADGSKDLLHGRPLPREGVDILLGSKRSRPEIDPYLKGVAVNSVGSLSSALKFCRIAEGIADLYIRTGPTMEWDTASGHAIVEAVGGKVCTLDCKPLRYRKRRFENNRPWFAATGPAAEDLVQALRESSKCGPAN